MIGDKTRKRLRKIGGILFPLGIVIMVLGSGVQVFIYLSSGGTEVARAPLVMVWAGIFATLGITMIVAGYAMKLVSRFRDEEAEAGGKDSTKGDNSA